MKKIYVIGETKEAFNMEKVKMMLELSDDVEVICVESIEDVPLEDRIKSEIGSIREIHKITARPVMPEICEFYIDKKKKGHERPYKYHP